MEQVTHSSVEDRTRIDNLAAGPEFYELLDFVKEVCLTDQASFQNALEEVKKRPRTPEGDLLAATGLWALKDAISLTLQPEQFFNDEVIAEVGSIPGGSALKQPEQFGAGVDHDVQDNIEALGKSILDEAFTCLGEDAQDQVDRYKETRDPSERFDILNWLIFRIIDIRDKYENNHPFSLPNHPSPDEIAEIIEEIKEDYIIRVVPYSGPEIEVAGTVEIEIPDIVEEDIEQKYVWHPIRLSPKLLGIHPDTQYTPTCLGISILAASFFEKIGEPYLHAGVAKSLLESAWRTLEQVPDLFAETAKRLNVILPDSIQKILDELKTSAEKTLGDDNGYHAAVLSRSNITDQWTQLDVNYHSSIEYGRDESERVDEVFEVLTDISEHIAGMEYMFEGSIINIESTIQLIETITEVLYRSPKLVDDVLNNMIKKAENGQEIYGVFETYMHTWLTSRHQPIGRINRSLVYQMYSLNGAPSKSSKKFFASNIERVFSNYVLKDVPPEQWRNEILRCKTDQAYRARRIEDLKMAPLMGELRIITQYTNRANDKKFISAHRRFEVGLPHYRIGAAVLSDFSVYCGDNLPTSFWLAHWPSIVAFTEHFETSNSNSQQIENTRNVGQLILASCLQYTKKFGIVTQFLEQSALRQTGEDEHDNESS